MFETYILLLLKYTNVIILDVLSNMDYLTFVHRIV